MWNDETSRIDDIANTLNLNVKKVFPINENIEEDFFDVIRAMEMPYTQSSPHVQYVLMKNGKDLGVKVTLNGHGPDEMLGGYPLRHCSLIAAEQFTHMQFLAFKQSISSMKEIHNIGVSDFFYALIFHSFPSLANYFRAAFRYPKKKYFNRDCFKEHPTVASRTLDKYTGGHSFLDRRLRQEFFYEVLPHILMYEDKMSMAASIESRVPFLDYRIVEFAFRLPDSQKIKNSATKYILRESMKESLPSSIINENLKLYFNGPIDKWLKGQLKPIVSDLLFKKDSLIAEYMNSNKYMPLVNRVINSSNYDDWDERLVWRMLITESWLNEFT
jgi:asparagine synthase (glutamine-hydrolysing)